MLTVLGTLGVVVVTIVLGVLADRRWGLFPDKQKLLAAQAPKRLGDGHGPGEAPHTALTLTLGELELLRRKQRHCRRPMDTLADDEIQFDGRTLRVLRFRCTRCSAETSRYVAT